MSTPAEITVRLATEADAEEVAAAYARNRVFLAPWEPERDAAFFTPAHQRAELAAGLDAYAADRVWPGVIVRSGAVVGRITLSAIVRRAFCSANLGYWVDAAVNGQGVATAAVAAALRVGFDDLRLHRVQAATLLHNAASQRVLARNGFTEIGLAPDYLRIAGRWQDHRLFQRLNDAWVP